jgi:two-component system nitrate/nitrite sensor histidine kinase NarX
MQAKFKALIQAVNRISQRSVYAKLLLILLSVATSILLIQAGTLFLLDYIPSNHRALEQIHKQSVYWQRNLAQIEMSEPEQVDSLLRSLQQHQPDSSEFDTRWLHHQESDEITVLLASLEHALIGLKQAEQRNRQVHYSEQIATIYQQLSAALYLDSDTKLSVIVLLQVISLIFVFCCLYTLLVSARHILVYRLDNLVGFINLKTGDNPVSPSSDEFSGLELKVSELSAQMESYKSEVGWAHQTSEHIRLLVRSLDFLFEFIDQVSDDVMSDRTVLKMAYSLERTLDLSNVALIYTDDADVISSDHVLYSHHKPLNLTENFYTELLQSGMAGYDYIDDENNAVKCHCIVFSGINNGVGVLLLEMDPTRYLEGFELRILEITAALLSMVSKFQSHDEEGRRLAVLEERAAIARELHDSLAQSLSFMKIQVSRLQSKAGTEQQADIVQELREGLDTAYRELRELLTTFRVNMDLRGLGYAIKAAIDELSQRSQIDINFDNRLVNCRMTVNEEFHLLHVVREALSNIVRHSGAKHVTILMLLNRSGELELTIDDDGVGISPTADSYDHYGQTIMKERANTLGGKLDVMTLRTGGTRVRLVFMPTLAQ